VRSDCVLLGLSDPRRAGAARAAGFDFLRLASSALPGRSFRAVPPSSAVAVATTRERSKGSANALPGLPIRVWKMARAVGITAPGGL
jgi:hypothetical protein